MAFGARKQGWNVTILDIDQAALDRTKSSIYPSRYGKWDNSIELALVSDETVATRADVVIIGTPPDFHVPIALRELAVNTPAALMIEKPLTGPSMENLKRLRDLCQQKGVFGCVSYNHTTTANTILAEKYLRDGAIGNVVAIDVNWQEHWGGIFKAHPWLEGPHDSYLGYIKKGGGALSEHSHCLNIWQHFANVCGMGMATTLSAGMKMVHGSKGEHYDSYSTVYLETEKGLAGSVTTDVVSSPAVKRAKIQGDAGWLEWHVNYRDGFDAVLVQTATGDQHTHLIKKTRPDDFQNELAHVESIILRKTSSENSPVRLATGIATMLQIAGAVKSWETGRRVTIDYDAMKVE